MSIEYVELTITDAEPINITISDIPEASAGGGGLSPIAAQTLLGNNTGSTALPTGLTAEQARTLLSVYSTSQVDTALDQRVLSTDPRLGVIYDSAFDNIALRCSDEEWTFGTTLQRDNLRIALQAAHSFSTNITGANNVFAVTPPNSAAEFASLSFQSHSGPSGDDFGTAIISANAEEGIALSSTSNVVLTSGVFSIQVTSAGYVVSNPSEFRTAISAAAASHTHGNITNAGAIGTTANLPIITGASGVLQAGSFGTAANTFAEGLALETVKTAVREVITVALSGYDTAISTGDGKGFLRVRIGGRIESVTIDCDPNNEPVIGSIIVDCSKINRTTGAATSLLSTKATITTGNNTGTGTLDGTQSVSAGDLLRFDVDQAADGKELLATVVINPFL
jgi:hypothetical protein